MRARMKSSERRNRVLIRMDPDGPRCDRCKSMMVHEQYYGPNDYFWGWRCICCGDIIDSTILENRRLFPSRTRAVAAAGART